MSHPRVAMIPCAGFGTRMGAYTRTVPKPLLPVNGVPLLFYSLFLLHLWDVELCVINLHYLGGQIREALRDFPHFPIVFSEEPGRILGTAGGIRRAMTMAPLHGWFLFINPDTIFWPGLDPFSEAFRLVNQGMLTAPASFLYVSPRQPGSAERGFTPLSPFRADPPHAPLRMDQGDWFYSGLSILHGQAVAWLPEGEPYELRDIFAAQAIAENLFGRPFPPDGKRLDCGAAADFDTLKSVDPVPPALKDRWRAFLNPWARPKP